jgi:hypothetical protein
MLSGSGASVPAFEIDPMSGAAASSPEPTETHHSRRAS